MFQGRPQRGRADRVAHEKSTALTSNDGDAVRRRLNPAKDFKEAVGVELEDYDFHIVWVLGKYLSLPELVELWERPPLSAETSRLSSFRWNARAYVSEQCGPEASADLAERLDPTQGKMLEIRHRHVDSAWRHHIGDPPKGLRQSVRARPWVPVPVMVEVVEGVAHLEQDPKRQAELWRFATAAACAYERATAGSGQALPEDWVRKVRGLVRAGVPTRAIKTAADHAEVVWKSHQRPLYVGGEWVGIRTHDNLFGVFMSKAASFSPVERRRAAERKRVARIRRLARGQ